MESLQTRRPGVGSQTFHLRVVDLIPADVFGERLTRVQFADGIPVGLVLEQCVDESSVLFECLLPGLGSHLSHLS